LSDGKNNNHHNNKWQDWCNAIPSGCSVGGIGNQSRSTLL
jgi:hypothetical protein